MSTRANAFILERGHTSIYYNKHAAEHLPATLHGGPSHTFPWSLGWELESTPMDDVWCEGAVLLDFDRRRMRFFGGDRIAWEPWSRRASLALLRVLWRGWDVGYANEGLRTLLEVANLGSTIVEERESEVAVFREASDLAEVRYVITLAGYGTVGLAVDSRPLRSQLPLVFHSAGAFDTLRAMRPLSAWPHEQRLLGGAHVDPAARTLRIWHSRADARARAALERALPGFYIDWLPRGYIDQLSLAGVDPAAHLVPAEDALRAVFSIDSFLGTEWFAGHRARDFVLEGFAPPRIVMKGEPTAQDLFPCMVRCVRGERVWDHPTEPRRMLG
jgi:hypothetical protein